jgi:tyrosyl-tRNA synthetase
MKFPSLNEQMDLIRRGVDEIVPEDELVKKLERSIETGKPLIIKEGFDPTAPDLHLGHMVTIRKLKQFQDLGHTVVFLIGDFTGMVGDPTGKSKTRPPMTREDVAKNAETYKEQVFQVLDPEKTVIRFNSEWLGAMSIYDFMGLAGKQTVARMMERDDFSKRYKAQQDISILEFLYCLLQGYDSVALEADVECGGTDQKFNLLTGRTLQRRYGKEPQCILTMPLLVGTDGVEKMSKSLGNYIGVQDVATDIYGKVMSIPDSLIETYFVLGTEVSDAEIKELCGQLSDSSVNPMDIKRRLARELVALYNDDKAAEFAESEFNRVFSKKEDPSDMPELPVSADEISVIDLMVQAEMVKSKGEARRLIKQGAVKLDGEAVGDTEQRITPADGTVLKAGKRRFARLVVNN